MKTLTLEETAAWLLANDGYTILTHRRPDGDALGSAAGLCFGLRKLGKRAFVLENPQTTDRYRPMWHPIPRLSRKDIFLPWILPPPGSFPTTTAVPWSSVLTITEPIPFMRT